MDHNAKDAREGIDGGGVSSNSTVSGAARHDGVVEQCHYPASMVPLIIIISWSFDNDIINVIIIIVQYDVVYL